MNGVTIMAWLWMERTNCSNVSCQGDNTGSISDHSNIQSGDGDYFVYIQQAFITVLEQYKQCFLIFYLLYNAAIANMCLNRSSGLARHTPKFELQRVYRWCRFFF